MQVKVTDEMIARYLSGKATPEEESAVLDYLSENDERFEDLLAMSAAIELNSTESKENASVKLSPFTSAQAAVVAGTLCGG